MEMCQVPAKTAGSQRTGAQAIWRENPHKCRMLEGTHSSGVDRGPPPTRALIGRGSARGAFGPFTTDNISLHELAAQAQDWAPYFTEISSRGPDRPAVVTSSHSSG